jgi:hypothetical protein
MRKRMSRTGVAILFLSLEHSTEKISLSELVAMAPHLDKCYFRQVVV